MNDLSDSSAERVLADALPIGRLHFRGLMINLIQNIALSTAHLDENVSVCTIDTVSNSYFMSHILCSKESFKKMLDSR